MGQAPNRLTESGREVIESLFFSIKNRLEIFCLFYNGDEESSFNGFKRLD